MTEPSFVQPCFGVGSQPKAVGSQPAAVEARTAEIACPIPTNSPRPKATVLLAGASPVAAIALPGSIANAGSGTQFIDVSQLASPQPVVGAVPIPGNEPVQGVRSRLMPAPGLPASELRMASEATVAEVPVVRTPPALAAQPPAHAERASNASAGPIPARANTAEKSSASALERLGTLTRRYPVGVIGGALLGTIALFVFLVGAAQILGLSANAGQQRAAAPTVAGAPADASASSATQPSAIPAAPAANSLVSVVTSSTSAPMGSGLQQAPAASTQTNSVPNDTQGAAASDPNLRVAVGHLFSGRLPEAEQAYRDLAAHHPGDQTYPTLVRLLARRNSPDCRPVNQLQKACPVVKP